jgi:hypothetical protein
MFSTIFCKFVCIFWIFVRFLKNKVMRKIKFLNISFWIILLSLFSIKSQCQDIEVYFEDKKLDLKKSLSEQGIISEDTLKIVVKPDIAFKKKHLKCKSVQIISLKIIQIQKNNLAAQTILLHDTQEIPLGILKPLKGEKILINPIKYFIINEDKTQKVLDSTEKLLTFVF